MAATATDDETYPARAVRARGRPPLPAADVEDRRRKIIDAAARMFFSQGFGDSTLDAIGREAGVTKRTIYELIGDKNALFHAACARLRVSGPHFEFAIPINGRPPRAVLLDMAQQLIGHAMTPDLIALERAMIVESARNPGVVSDVLKEGKDALMCAIAAIFDDLVAGGALPPTDTLRAADLFYDLIVGARGFRAAMGHPTEDTGAADIADRVDVFLRGRFGV